MPARTPTNVLERRGAFKNHPERRRDREFEPIVTDPLGSPPDHLAENERKCWLELAECAPTGVLTRADRQAVEFASILLARFRLEKSEMPPPLMIRLHGFLAAFGMTPADRSKVGVKSPTKPKSKFDD